MKCYALGRSSLVRHTNVFYIIMPYCAVSACRHISNKNNLRNGGISYHRFPHDSDVKEKWIFATGRKLWQPTKLSTICSAHFKDDDFAVKMSGNRYLKRGSIPSLHVWMKQSTVETKHQNNYEGDLIDEIDNMCGYENCADYLEETTTEGSMKRTHSHAVYEEQRKKSRHGTDDFIIDYNNIDKFGEQIAFLLKRIPKKLCRELQDSIVTLVKTATKEYDSNNKRYMNTSTSSSNELNEASDLPLSNYNDAVEEITIKVEPFDMQIEDESAVNGSIDEINHMDGQTQSPLEERLCDSINTVSKPIILPIEVRNDLLENDKAKANNRNINNTAFFDVEVERIDGDNDD